MVSSVGSTPLDSGEVIADTTHGAAMRREAPDFVSGAFFVAGDNAASIAGVPPATVLRHMKGHPA